MTVPNEDVLNAAKKDIPRLIVLMKLKMAAIVLNEDVLNAAKKDTTRLIVQMRLKKAARKKVVSNVVATTWRKTARSPTLVAYAGRKATFLKVCISNIFSI